MSFSSVALAEQSAVSWPADDLDAPQYTRLLEAIFSEECAPSNHRVLLTSCVQVVVAVRGRDLDLQQGWLGQLLYGERTTECPMQGN